MSIQIDDKCLSGGYRVERVKNKLLIYKNKGTTVIAEREYGTTHAAVCALGRCKFDNDFPDTIIKKIKIEELKGKRSNPKNKNTAMKMEQIALTALETLAEERDEPLEKTTSYVMKKVKGKIKEGIAFIGSFKLRDIISEFNKEHKEQKDKE